MGLCRGRAMWSGPAGSAFSQSFSTSKSQDATMCVPSGRPAHQALADGHDGPQLERDGLARVQHGRRDRLPGDRAPGGRRCRGGRCVVKSRDGDRHGRGRAGQRDRPGAGGGRRLVGQALAGHLRPGDGDQRPVPPRKCDLDAVALGWSAPAGRRCRSGRCPAGPVAVGRKLRQVAVGRLGRGASRLGGGAAGQRPGPRDRRRAMARQARRRRRRAGCPAPAAAARSTSMAAVAAWRC